jgi:hypothetical protein
MRVIVAGAKGVELIQVSRPVQMRHSDRLATAEGFSRAAGSPALSLGDGTMARRDIGFHLRSHGVPLWLY